MNELTFLWIQSNQKLKLSYREIKNRQQGLGGAGSEVLCYNKLICSPVQAWISISGIYNHQTMSNAAWQTKKKKKGFRRLPPRTPGIAGPNPPLICSRSLCKYSLKTIPEQNRRLKGSWTKEQASSFNLTSLLCQNRSLEWRQRPGHRAPLPMPSPAFLLDIFSAGI